MLLEMNEKDVNVGTVVVKALADNELFILFPIKTRLLLREHRRT
jgi:hypothetical protein